MAFFQKADTAGPSFLDPAQTGTLSEITCEMLVRFDSGYASTPGEIFGISGAMLAVTLHTGNFSFRITARDSTSSSIVNQASGTNKVTIGVWHKIRISVSLIHQTALLYVDDVNEITAAPSPNSGAWQTNRTIKAFDYAAAPVSVGYVRIWREAEADGSLPVSAPWKEIQGDAATVNADAWKNGADAIDGSGTPPPGATADVTAAAVAPSLTAAGDITTLTVSAAATTGTDTAAGGITDPAAGTLAVSGPAETAAGSITPAPAVAVAGTVPIMTAAASAAPVAAVSLAADAPAETAAASVMPAPMMDFFQKAAGSGPAFVDPAQTGTLSAITCDTQVRFDAGFVATPAEIFGISGAMVSATLNTNNGSFRLSARDSTNTQVVNQASGDDKFQLDTWHRIRIVVSLADQLALLFVDDVLMISVTGFANAGAWQTNRTIKVLDSGAYPVSVGYIRIWRSAELDGSIPPGLPWKQIQGDAATVNADAWKSGTDAVAGTGTPPPGSGSVITAALTAAAPDLAVSASALPGEALTLGAVTPPVTASAVAGVAVAPITIDDFTKDDLCHGTGFHLGEDYATPVISGTSDPGTVIEVRAIEDGGPAATAWVEVTADGSGNWSAQPQVPRATAYWRGQGRVKASPAVTATTGNRFATGSVFVLWQQSEDDQLAITTLDGQTPEAVVDDEAVQMAWYDSVSDTLRFQKITDASPHTSAFAAMANVCAATAPGEHFLFVWQCRSGTDPRELFDDADTDRPWSVDQALHDSVFGASGNRADLVSVPWYAAPGSLGEGYADALAPGFTGMDIDGNPVAIPGVHTYSGGSVVYDHAWVQLYDFSRTRYLDAEAHRFDPLSGNMLGLETDAAGAADDRLKKKRQVRIEQREQLAGNPNFAAFWHDRPAIGPNGYMNGYDAGGGSWVDLLHPGNNSPDGKPLFARLRAYGFLCAAGFTAWDMPQFDQSYMEPTGAYVEVWSSAGDITTGRIERGLPALPSTYPHWTPVAGFEIDMRPAENVSIVSGRVRILPNSGSVFEFWRYLSFGRGGAGALRTPDDQFNDYHLNFPLVDVGAAHVDGIPLRPMPIGGVLNFPFPGAPADYARKVSGAGPAFRDPSTFPAATGDLTIVALLRFGSPASVLGDLMKISGNFMSLTFNSANNTLALQIKDGAGATVFGTQTSNHDAIILDSWQNVRLSISLVGGWVKLFVNDRTIFDATFTAGNTAWPTNRYAQIVNGATQPIDIARIAVWLAAETDGSEPATAPRGEMTGGAPEFNAWSWHEAGTDDALPPVSGTAAVAAAAPQITASADVQRVSAETVTASAMAPQVTAAVDADQPAGVLAAEAPQVTAAAAVQYIGGTPVALQAVAPSVSASADGDQPAGALAADAPQVTAAAAVQYVGGVPVSGNVVAPQVTAAAVAELPAGSVAASAPAISAAANVQPLSGGSATVIADAPDMTATAAVVQPAGSLAASVPAASASASVYHVSGGPIGVWGRAPALDASAVVEQPTGSLAVALAHFASLTAERPTGTLANVAVSAVVSNMTAAHPAAAGGLDVPAPDALLSGSGDTAAAKATRYERAARAVADILRTLPGLDVYRGDPATLDAATAPFVDVDDTGGVEEQEATLSPYRRHFIFEIRLTFFVLRGTSAVWTRRALDDLLAQASAALLADPTLGGVVDWLQVEEREDLTDIAVAGGTEAISVQLPVTVFYTTSENALEVV